jgi:predicted ribosomally synthesized peptide with SipW-like signal peptide
MKKKLFAVCLVVALLVVAAVGSTLAYFTDTTEKATNTFTVGKVDIDLDEAKVVDGQADRTADRVIENDYDLMPGITYDKDPTVHVIKGSKTCYVRAFVTFNDAEELAKILGDSEVTSLLKLIDVDTTKWDVTAYGDNPATNTLTLELRYKETVNAEDSTDNIDLVIFEHFATPENLENDALGGFKITVRAQAIQAEGFENGADAFDKLPNPFTTTEED